jgi:ubiquinone/menaquinone biosynthesis C-methylase UbiE
MKSKRMNWEEAVKHLRTIPEQAGLVRDAYLDEDNIEAAKRFASSEEFREVLTILQESVTLPRPWTVLDIGSGNGIAAYAFARSGSNVFALEPDPSDEIGTGAIRRLQKIFALNIEILEHSAEKISLADGVADIAYVRQALHHASDLQAVLNEIHRVLRPGGCLLACREHVVDDDKQLEAFLASHPLHPWYGGEHAYSLDMYRRCIRDAGFRLKKTLGPFETVINVAPASIDDMICALATRLKFPGSRSLVAGLWRRETTRSICSRILAGVTRIPGRLYSFVALKEGTDQG